MGMDLRSHFRDLNGARVSCQGLCVSGIACRTVDGPDGTGNDAAAGTGDLSVTVDELRLQGVRIEAPWPPAGARAIVHSTAAAAPAHGTPVVAGTAHMAAWDLMPLDGLAGALRIAVTDAAWLFDADVRVPIEAGRIDFNHATVSHVGPDSSMGLSRMGIYVDAPNGRQYLALLAAGHVDGARFEHRGALLASRVTDRGALALVPLLRAFLSGARPVQPAAGAEALLARTRLDARLRLADGRIGRDGAGLALTGAAAGRNQVELMSTPEAGLLLRWPELSAEHARWPLSAHGGRDAGCCTAASLQGSLSVELRRHAGGRRGVTLQAPELVLRQFSLHRPQAGAGT